MHFSFHRFWQIQLPLMGMAVALIALVIISAASYSSINELQARASWVEHTYQAMSALDETLSLQRDAETGARGFVITGHAVFLEPFDAAKRMLPQKITALRSLMADNARQLHNIETLVELIEQRSARLQTTINLRQGRNGAALASAFVETGQGKSIMDRLRSQVEVMQVEEERLLVQRSQKAEQSARNTKKLILFGTAAAFLTLSVALLLLVRAIRQRQTAEAALAKANQDLVRHASELEITNQELDSFSYSVSHDLRIPLRAVSGYSKMLEEDYTDKLDGEGLRLLQVIRENSKRMGDLIDDLLAFSKLGRKAVLAAEVDMNRLIALVIEEVTQRESHPNRKIVVGILPAAWGDRPLLLQVWVNLISNACKYSGSKAQSMISINGEQTGSETIYSITDNGVGFDMQYYGKLFGVFQRLHSTAEFPGTGVGLAIVQRIVTRHGGRVWAEAKIGEGATFFLALPRKGESNGQV